MATFLPGEYKTKNFLKSSIGLQPPVAIVKKKKVACRLTNKVSEIHGLLVY